MKVQSASKSRKFIEEVKTNESTIKNQKYV